ncbi:hypothetical protein [Micromonospora profundi]|uniref:hypothetical protein n=1 Tax=Micromonospora profundi TaxID=1420889 RepID=UPI0036481A7A
MSAAEALRSAQQTFNRAQVACLIALAFQAGHRLGVEEGHRERNDALAEGLRLALGGPEARTMSDAVSRHIRVVDQKRRREDADRQARHPRPHGLRLVDPDWPPATEPGSLTVEQARAVSAHIWHCPCQRRTEPHWLDGYHRTPEPFPGIRQVNVREAA